jgi:cytochrome c oxidase subunit 1
VTLAADRPGWRSPFPLVWLGGAILVACFTALGPGALPPDAAYVSQDTYYVVLKAHYVLSLTAVFLVMAGLYLLFDHFRLPYRRVLAWWHFGLTSLGVSLVFAPMVLLGLVGMPRRHVDFPDVFSVLSKISSVGYVLTLGGLAVLIWLTGEALVRKARGS